jgi:rubrerythrin
MDDRILMEPVLDFAIGAEQAAADIYAKSSALTEVPGMREAFEGFAPRKKAAQSQARSH